jgi:hypothetical protein
MTDRLKIGQEVLIHGYVDEIRKDTVIIQNDGGYFGTVEHEITDIEASDTNEVLDKIRAEIKAMSTDYCGGYIGLDKQEVLKIIDKYREVRE